MNHKRLERIWRQESLKVPAKQPKRRRLWLADRSCIRLRPTHRNHVWSYDFVMDRTSEGRAFRMLTIVDEFTRERLAIDVARKLTSEDVLERLSELFVCRGVPDHIRSDNGSDGSQTCCLKPFGLKPLFGYPPLRSPTMARLFGFVATLCLLAVPVFAQEAQEDMPAFAEPKKDWAWDEDKRFDFLMERLASLEASLDVVEQAIAKASGKKGAKLGEARRAEANNTMMDRKGGGPMKWNEFYGTTAEKFFYHPVDPNTTYHTNTVLQQMGSSQDDKVGAGVPATQSLPVHQRPPQFDYIYRANRDAKERAEAEAAALEGQLESLNQRREKLEAEQADLWCRLAFRAIQRLNIPRRPVLRFHLVASSTQPDDQSRAEVLEAAARFLASALLIIEKADTEQEAAFSNIKVIVTNARNEYDDALLTAGDSADDGSDRTTPLGQFTALAQLLDDTANNLSESYEVAIDGGRFKDAARKEQFRGLLQRSLVEYAQILMALDELTRSMQKDWRVKVDTKNKVPLLEVSWNRPGYGPRTLEGLVTGESPRPANLNDDDDDSSGESSQVRGETGGRRKAPARSNPAITKSIQPVPEPKGLSEEIRTRLPTAEELETLRNAVNLPQSQVLQAKGQYLKRIYAAYGIERWTAVDVGYLMAMNDALSGMTGVSTLETPHGTASGPDVSHFLAQHWVLKSRDTRQFVERVRAMDPKTRGQFDRMVLDREIQEWMLIVTPPLQTAADKAKALDSIIQAGVLSRGVIDLRRSLQPAIESR